MKSKVIRAYLGYNIVLIQKQLMDIASLIKNTSNRSTSITDSTHCFNYEILYSGGNNVSHIIEEVRSSVHGQIKISVDPVLYRPPLEDTIRSEVSCQM